MPDLPFDPPKERPPRGPAIVITADADRAPQQYGHRDILAMYPALRLDHLRYLEKCGLIKPAYTNHNERVFGFADLTALRQIAGELQQGAPFRAVVRNLQASKTGQLAFDFRLDAQPARIIELKPRNTNAPRVATTPSNIDELSPAEQYFLMGSLLDDGTPDRIEEAVKAYRRALDHDPDLVAALINLANIRYSRDELAEAQALYERAIVLDPSYFEALDAPLLAGRGFSAADAVPGTRVACANKLGSAVHGTARSRSACRSFARPSRQVMKPANISAASASGTQPPLAILVALPKRNARSTSKNSRTGSRCAVSTSPMPCARPLRRATS